MANEIPPFLPASPPPMCKLDFDEDEDDDEFGDFSNASESCYHDNVSVSKATGDNALNNTKQVFDPGTLFIETIPNHEEALKNSSLPNGIKENSFGDFTHNYETVSTIDVPVQKPSNENVSITENNVFNSIKNGDSDNLDASSEIRIPVDCVVENTVNSTETVLSSGVDNCNDIPIDLNLNEEDSSIDDSVSINCDKNSATNYDNISINFDNDELENDASLPNFYTTNESPAKESSLQPSSVENIETLTEPKNDFTTLFSGTESKENIDSSTLNVLPLSTESTETNILERRMSEDSDDSNVPDIDFSCFITCPNEIENENISKEDDFGDFAKPVETNFFGETPIDALPQPHSDSPFVLESDDQIRPNELKSVTQVTIDQIQVNESSDVVDDDFDDFADFVSTSCQPAADNIEQNNDDDFEPFSDYYSKNETSQFAIQNESNFIHVTEPSSSSDLAKTYDLDMECWNEVFQVKVEEQIEVNLNTFEGKLNSSSVWCKIKEIESSPALTYNWNNSETQKILLSALYVDSRNILFGPRWNSEVPRFASNLGFSPLVPQKALDKKDDQPVEILPKHPAPENTSLIDDTNNIALQVPGSVPEAHFDWNNSGLTNPLDSYSHSSLLDLDLLASFDIHSPYYKKNRKVEKKKDNSLNPTNYENSLFAKSPHREKLSEEAKEVLNNLPNLYVMEKQYIVFPVS